MKRRSILNAGGLIMILLLASVAGAQAQHAVGTSDSTHGKYRYNHMRAGQAMGGIQGLTADQQKKIQAADASYRKETLQISNQLAEKRAHLNSLQSADKADMKAINATIDEMSQLQSQLQKKSAARHESIRQVLTDEQRVAFDTKRRDGRKFHGGMRRGDRHGHGHGKN